jgi:ATP-dependent exoDNAse (exonuclease V) beta subunit
LRSLPSEEFRDLMEELNKLLSAAAAAEANDVSLADFARNLRTNYNATRETHPSSAHAIQLITAQKAKGSQWQAVIVPFLSREVRIGAARYPRVIEANGAQIVFDRTDFIEHEEQIEQSERQEMERLLYVALTRARHTLVLAVDREFFLTSKRRIPRDSQLKWLRGDEGENNYEAIAALPTEMAECAETFRRQGAVALEGVRENLGPLRLETGWIDSARHNGAAFIHTVSPSKFGPEKQPAAATGADVWKEIEPELRPPRIDNPATRYGVWWHDFAQRISWSTDAAARETVFKTSVAASPDPARSKREWQMLAKQFPGKSDFARRFEPRIATFPEMPFFWRVNASTCLEGIVDLALFDRRTGKWLIVDWKTNRIPPDKIDNLRAQYRPQIAAYWKALATMTDNEVEAGIYFTSMGEFALYDDAALAAEWERLRKLPPGDLADAIVAGDELSTRVRRE